MVSSHSPSRQFFIPSKQLEVVDTSKEAVVVLVVLEVDTAGIAIP